MYWRRARTMAGLVLAVMWVAACGGSTNTGSTSNDLLSTIKARGVIRLATQTDDPGGSTLKPDGTYEGFNIQVGEAIAKDLGVRIEYLTPTWGVMTAGHWGGRWDAVVQGMTITGKRQQVISYSKPYNFIDAQFAASKASGITSVDQLSGKTICVGLGTTYEQWLKGALDLGTYQPKNGPPANVKVITNEVETNCAEAWKAGRNDAQGWLTASYTVDQAVKDGLPVTKVGSPVFQAPLAVATDKSGLDPTSFLAEVNKVLQRLQSDGTLKTWSLKWFGFDNTEPVSA